MNLMESIIDIPNEHTKNVFGHIDAYVKIIEKTLNVTIVSRDGEIKVIGDAAQVAKAKSVFLNLVELSKRGNVITEQNVNYALSLSYDNKEAAIVEIDQD